MNFRERRSEWRELTQICESLHTNAGWRTVPWSPNKSVVCLESIDGKNALFSVFAPYMECWGKVTGTVTLPLSECSSSTLEEAVERVISDLSAVREDLTLVPEAFDLHMKPTRPGKQGPAGNEGLPIPGVSAGEMHGDSSGPANSGTHKIPHFGGFNQLPVKPVSPAAAVKEKDKDPRARASAQAGDTVDHGYTETRVPPTGSAEKSRTNMHGVAIPEGGTAGTIDPLELLKYRGEKKKEALGSMGGWHGITPFDENGIRVEGEAPTKTSIEGWKHYKHAVAIVIREGKYILLGKSTGNDDRAGSWCFPGGGIDEEDGGDPVAAAQRETYEEMGLRVGTLGHVLTHPAKPTVAFVICFYADDKEPTPNDEFSQYMWLDYAIRHEMEGIYPTNISLIERIPLTYLYAYKDYSESFDSTVEDAESLLSETAAVKRQKPNKRAWAVSANSRRVTTGAAAEPHRRSIAGSSEKTKEKKPEKAISATQAIKGKKTLSSPGAPQDSAEKLHFTGAKNPRKAASDVKQDLDRVKQGRDPSALKPGDEGKPGKADASKDAKQTGGATPSPSPTTPAGSDTPQDGAAGQATASPLSPGSVGDGSVALIKAATALLKAAGGAAAPQGKAAAGGKSATGGPAGQAKKAPKPNGQKPNGNAAPEQAVPGQTAPGQAAAGQQVAPGQQGEQQPGLPGQGMPGQQMPGQQMQGVPNAAATPEMQGQGMPAFQARTVDMVLKDKGNADKMFRWLQALGFDPSSPDGTTVQVTVNTHDEMNMVSRTAKAFGLSLAGISESETEPLVFHA